VVWWCPRPRHPLSCNSNIALKHRQSYSTIRGAHGVQNLGPTVHRMKIHPTSKFKSDLNSEVKMASACFPGLNCNSIARIVLSRRTRTKSVSTSCSELCRHYVIWWCNRSWIRHVVQRKSQVLADLSLRVLQRSKEKCYQHYQHQHSCLVSSVVKSLGCAC